MKTNVANMIKPVLQVFTWRHQKFKLTELSILQNLYFLEVSEQLTTNIYTNVHFERVLLYAWNFETFAWRGIYMAAKTAVTWVKKVTYFGWFCYRNSSCTRKIVILMFRDSWIHTFIAKLSDRCFCWFRPPCSGAHTDRHQPAGVSTKISINLGYTFLLVSRISQRLHWPETWRES